MVNADLMDAMDRSLRQARQRPHEPFGGVQVVLFGDPYQLAPVPGSGDERRFFADTYRSMWFFDANVWQEADLRIYELGEIHRQHDDAFKHMLNAVRHGWVTAEIAGVLNDAGARRPLPEQGAITLATTNTDTNADPDFEIWHAGEFVRAGSDPPPGPEVETISNLAAGTYVIDVYDCGNGCNPAEGASGDFDLTVTIN